MGRVVLIAHNSRIRVKITHSQTYHKLTFPLVMFAAVVFILILSPFVVVVIKGAVVGACGKVVLQTHREAWNLKLRRIVLMGVFQHYGKEKTLKKRVNSIVAFLKMKASHAQKTRP